MRKLIINGHIADISDDEVIALSKENNAIFDFQNKRTNLSNKIKLPKSSQNNKIFGSAEDVMAVLRYDNVNKRNWYEVQYVQNYEEIIAAGTGILNSAKDEYEFTIYWGNVSIKDKLQDATIQDLDLSDLNHDYLVYNTVFREHTRPSTEFYYPLTSNVKEKRIPSGKTPETAIDILSLAPAVQLQRILRQITKDYHIFFEGIEDIESDTSLIIQTNKRELPDILSEGTEDRDYIGQNAVDVGKTNEQKFNIRIGETDEHIVPEIGEYELSFSFPMTIDRNRLGSSWRIWRNKFVLYTLVFAELYQDESWQEYNTFDAAWEAIQNGETCGARVRIADNRKRQGDNTYELSPNSKRIIDFQEGDRIRWRCISKVIDDSTFRTGTGFYHNYYVEPESEFSVGFEKVTEGMPIKIAENMPDVKLIDLLKYIASITGRLVDFKDGGNTIKFVSIEDFVHNIHNAHELTDNIQSIEIDQLHCDLGQSNIMKYDNHDDLPEMLGGGSFSIIDNTLEPVNDFYEAPFSASANESWRDWRIAKIPMAEPHDDVADKDGSIDSAGSRILQSELINAEIYYSFYDVSISSTYNKYIASFSERLSYKRIIQSRYRHYINVMNDYKFIKAQAYLTSSEFRAMDLMKPAYIKQLGGYFIINKIHNFVEGQLTEIHLTMLSYPVTPVEVVPPPVPPPPPPLTKALSLTVRENGKVTIDGDTYTTGSYTIFVEVDKEITLKGMPDQKYQFYKWTGDVESSNAEIQVTMHTERTLTAWFTLPRIKLEDSTGHILTEDGTYIFLE